MAAARCENCGADLPGEYCHVCGQQVVDAGHLTVRQFLRTAADEILHLESKTLRSIGLLFKPGALTAAYLTGRRAPFTSPIKLYLVCAAIFFLLAPLAGFKLEQMLADDPSGELARWVGADMAASGLDPTLYMERFDLRFQTVYTVSLFLSMMAGSAMLALLFRRQRRPFGAHVVFELHYVSFMYLIWIVLGIALQSLPSTIVTVLATLVVLVPYLFIALSRVYRESRGRIVWKTVAMILFALAFNNAVNFLALVVTLKLV